MDNDRDLLKTLESILPPVIKREFYGLGAMIPCVHEKDFWHKWDYYAIYDFERIIKFRYLLGLVCADTLGKKVYVTLRYWKERVWG